MFHKLFTRPVGKIALATAIFAGIGTSPVSAATLTVPGDANIFGAGHATAPGGGELPPGYSFTSGGTVLTLSSVIGTITTNGSTFNDPDGVGAAVSSSTTASVGGISGIDAPNAGYLVGVFLNNSEPANPAPSILDFRTIGTNFSTLSPALDQTFSLAMDSPATALEQRSSSSSRMERRVSTWESAMPPAITALPDLSTIMAAPSARRSTWCPSPRRGLFS